MEFYEFCWVHEALTNIIRLIQQLDVRLVNFTLAPARGIQKLYQSGSGARKDCQGVQNITVFQKSLTGLALKCFQVFG